jgi:hypothetical protein
MVQHVPTHAQLQVLGGIVFQSAWMGWKQKDWVMRLPVVLALSGRNVILYATALLLTRVQVKLEPNAWTSALERMNMLA